MARIPLGNFGNAVPQEAPVLQAPAGAFGGGVAQALQQLGNTGMQVAADAMHKQRQEEEQQAGTDAAQGFLNFKVEARAAVHEITKGLQTGEISPADAQETFTKQAQKLSQQHIGSLPGTRFRNIAEQEVKREELIGLADVANGVETIRRQSYAADATASLDSYGKLAVLPNASLDEALKGASVMYPVLARRAGIPEQQAAKTLQDWQDGVRFNRAQLDLTAERHDAEGLDTFTKRLDSGDLSGTLDPAKRVMLVKEADSYKWQLEQRAQAGADKAEKIADRAITNGYKQIEAGVPFSAQGWSDLQAKTKGTSFEGEVVQLIRQERETQQVLRLPLDQQEAYVQSREAQLMQNGGTLADKGNLNRIKATVETNSKQLENAPLLAAQRLYGINVPPLDLGRLLSPGGTDHLEQVLADRLSTLGAMQKQFGPRVALKPLLPQEASQLSKTIESVSPGQAVDLYGVLRTAVNDDELYRAVIQQIAPDSPVKARAGLIAAMRVGVTLEHNMILPDVGTSSRKVAETMLAGEAILNKTKAQASQDGKAHSLFVPSHAAFSSQFADAVGDLYRGRSNAQEIDLQAAMAYYVGKSAQTGKLVTDPKDVDGALVRESINATMGTVLDFNGVGKVQAPIGMSGEDMQRKIREQFAQEVRARGLPAEMVDQLGSYGLVNYKREGQYVMTLGGLPVVDPKTRAPIVLDIVNLPATLNRIKSIDRIPK